MRLNLGCGDFYAYGWVNVDYRSPFLCDMVVDLREDLPWPDGSVTHIYAGHIFEHLTVEEGTNLLRRMLLPAVPGAELMIVGPDVHRAKAMTEAGEMDEGLLEQVQHGGHRWEGDDHKWDCEPQTLMTMLKEASWDRITEVPIEDVDEFWPVVARPLWQCAVYARRPLMIRA